MHGVDGVVAVVEWLAIERAVSTQRAKAGQWSVVSGHSVVSQLKIDDWWWMMTTGSESGAATRVR